MRAAIATLLVALLTLPVAIWLHPIAYLGSLTLIVGAALAAAAGMDPAVQSLNEEDGR